MYFEEITKYHAAPVREQRITADTIEFAKTRGLSTGHSTQTLTASKLMMLLSKPASDGYKNFEETVILQSHIDMVCQKEEGSGA